MFRILEKAPWLKIFNLTTYSLVFLLIDIIGYQFLIQLKMQQYWVAMPVLLYLISIFINNSIKRIHNVIFDLRITSLVSLILLFCCINISSIRDLFMMQFEIIAFIIIAILFIDLIISMNIKKETEPVSKNDFSNKLFNLFYINTSKAHEIAMLIDNKIMKTVEKEQVSEELLKYNNSFTFGSKDKWSAESGYSKEDSSKKEYMKILM